MIDRDFEQVSEEHMKSMTKPEGPAQEPPCAECGVPRELHDDPKQYIAPATPAPSQPAGAREWLLARECEMFLSSHVGMSGKLLCDTLELYAAHQTAAKDAEIAELREIRDVVVTLLVKVTGWTRDRVEESPFNAAVAAEHERDSLAGELRTIDQLLARRPALDDCTNRYDKIAKALAFASRTDKAERENAALKAGKESHD